MDPAPFRDRKAIRRKGAGPAASPASGHKEPNRALAWIAPLANIALGSALLWGAARRFEHPLAAGWVGMVGFILVLHFGVFALLAVLWNAARVPVVPIMDCPVAAVSLAEFWGRRWNRAFRDLAHRLVFRPMARHGGQQAALWTSFAASALAHELVISVPAGAGFGLPTCYFLLQALGIVMERSADVAGCPRRSTAPQRGRSGLSKWLRTHAFTALPAFFLFHPPFVERVMLPFFHAIHALP